MTYAQLRGVTQRLADTLEVWEGLPVPIEEQPLRLYEGHPMAALFNRREEKPELGPEVKIRNRWWSWERSGWVWVYEEGGQLKHFVERQAPDRSMTRLDFWMMTLGASIAWDLEAEQVARRKLRAMVTPHAWRCYDLTGAFLETSSRSRVHYMFRRGRPTVALIPDKRGREDPEQGGMRVLAVLCLHPIGYYEGTWAGAMVPTDDVIAHLVMMRGDERLFWRKANQHEPASPEAGL